MGCLFSLVRALPGWRRIELALLLILAVAALGTRLVGLERYSGSYPEGVRAEQLLLMGLGFRPFKDIFSDQGPWLLDVLYPGFALFGPNLIGVRAVVVAMSLVGLGAAYWLGCQLSGRVCALVSVALLAASPTYLKFSRIAVAELVAIAPAMLSLAAAARFADAGASRWLVLSGLLAGVSLLIKPIVVGIVPAVALTVLIRPRRWRSLAILAATGGITILVGVLVVGLPEILGQIVVFRLQSRAVEGWSLAANLSRARQELGPEGTALYLLGALGLVGALASRRAWPLALWSAGSVATLAAHSPLHGKHFTLVVVPVVLLAGLALGRAAEFAGNRTRRWPGLAFGLLVSLAAALYAAALPSQLARDRELLLADDLFERDASAPLYGDAIATLERTTPTGSYIVTDHAYLAFAAARPVPPFLAEASATRVHAGTLTDDQAIDNTQRFHSQAVLLWADKLSDLRRYRSWVQREYLLARVWAAEDDTRPQLWLPRSGAASDYRAAMRLGLTPGPAEPLDGRLRAV